MIEVTADQLIFFSTEMALTCKHLDHCSRNGDLKELKATRMILERNVFEFTDVFDRYKKSKVINPILIEKSEKMLEFAIEILRLSSKVLREHLTIAPQLP